ncbi:hypothetical protein KVR01_012882 [Diaporthe batatas]|uniref:uncharacterized protein n=1 Tax=Diaporthe batatas TaxID=748121 RepID=UPI001D0461D3|nr:uncharacterized protein KVR01_012882 [Diaporthe batatas]KAG8157174.1 hypothetical protein KVR01_012882 [Diaporthe batatas]
MPTVYEQLLNCSGCNDAVLIKDPSASYSMVAHTGPVGIVIRHQSEETMAGVSWLDIFPFTAKHPLSNSPHVSGVEQQDISRHSICMENCTTPESRRDIAKAWGLHWWGFEQHFETIAAWTGSTLGVCPCECHSHKRPVEELEPKHADAGCEGGGVSFEDDDCGSVITTAPLVCGQESGRCPRKPRARVPRRGGDFPPGWPEEGRDRARSEEVRYTDLFILEWRERCFREEIRRETVR